MKGAAMKTFVHAVTVMVLAVGIGWGCGDNIGGTTSVIPGPPRNLKAYSVNQSALRLQWAASATFTDSMFLGYRITWLGREEIVTKGVLSFTAAGVPDSAVTFSVSSVLKDGIRSEAVSIRWAPAARFDSAIVLTEYSALDPNRICGLDVGSFVLNPRGLSMADPNAAALMDLYLWGDEGRASLSLLAAATYLGLWKPTRFSAVQSPSPSLDYFLSDFPSDYTEAGVSAADNTIYYVKVLDEFAQVHVARVHIQVLSDAAPDRKVAVRVSLQRAVALPFAEVVSGARPPVAWSVPLAAIAQ
jgi:hypothetical protein